MNATSPLLEVVMAEPDVSGAAIFRSDRSVVHRAFDAPLDRLGDVAATARHVFRETAPAVQLLDLSYANGRLVILPCNDDVVFLVARRALTVRALLARVRAYAADPPPAPPPASARINGAPARAAAELDVVAALNLITAEAKKILGGPVIRNYMKRAQRELAGGYPTLAELSVDLDGRVQSQGDAASAPAPRAVGILARRFLARASAVVPELATIDLRAVTGVHAAALAAHGFFDVDEERGSE